MRIEELHALTGSNSDDGDRDFVRALPRDYLAIEIADLLQVGAAVPDTVLKHLPAVVSPGGSGE